MGWVRDQDSTVPLNGQTAVCDNASCGRTFHLADKGTEYTVTRHQDVNLSTDPDQFDPDAGPREWLLCSGACTVQFVTETIPREEPPT